MRPAVLSSDAADHDVQQLLQISSQKKQIQLDLLLDEEEKSIVPNSSTIAFLRSGDDGLQVPCFLEITDLSEDAVRHELEHWGIRCHVLQFGGHPEFLCLPHDRSSCFDIIHYMYCTQQGIDAEASILHTHRGRPLQDLDHMKPLHQFGFLKTAILDIIVALEDVV